MGSNQALSQEVHPPTSRIIQSPQINWRCA
jgi:hypothetical protein